jgi:diguanylate cyclase (GGDEF)-like protein
MDGLAVCRRARERVVPYVYVLLLTAKDSRDDLLAALDAGADDFLTKPMDLTQLRARLKTGERVLGLQEALLEAHAALKHEATHDPLTGALNRTAIFDFLQREMRRAARQSQPMGVVLIDLDHFKKVNDTYGHLAGDAVLREAMQRIQAAVRGYDAVGRYGGEEFLVIVPGAGDDETRGLAERVREQIRSQHFGWDGGEIAVTASFGVATGSGDIDMEGLLRAADAALYRAKDGGRDRVEVAGGDDWRA